MLRHALPLLHWSQRFLSHFFLFVSILLFPFRKDFLTSWASLQYSINLYSGCNFEDKEEPYLLAWEVHLRSLQWGGPNYEGWPGIFLWAAGNSNRRFREQRPNIFQFVTRSVNTTWFPVPDLWMRKCPNRTHTRSSPTINSWNCSQSCNRLDCMPGRSKLGDQCPAILLFLQTPRSHNIPHCSILCFHRVTMREHP